MQSVLIVLGAIQVTWPVGLFILTGSADGMAGPGLAALLATQALGLVGLVILARMRQPFSRPTALRAMGVLTASLASNLVLAVTNLLGVTAGGWCLPLVLGLIPAIGLLRGYWTLRQTPDGFHFKFAAPVSTTTGM